MPLIGVSSLTVSFQVPTGALPSPALRTGQQIQPVLFSPSLHHSSGDPGVPAALAEVTGTGLDQQFATQFMIFVVAVPAGPRDGGEK